jgi:hypothetical protein
MGYVVGNFWRVSLAFIVILNFGFQNTMISLCGKGITSLASLHVPHYDVTKTTCLL